jgi:hypothetical protein
MLGYDRPVLTRRDSRDRERGLAGRAGRGGGPAGSEGQALIVHPDPLAFSHRREIADFGARKKIPIMAAYGFAGAGCLMSYDSPTSA